MKDYSWNKLNIDREEKYNRNKEEKLLSLNKHDTNYWSENLAICLMLENSIHNIVQNTADMSWWGRNK